MLTFLLAFAHSVAAQLQTLMLDELKPGKEQAYFISPTIYHLFDRGGRLEAREIIDNIESYNWQRSDDDSATIGNSDAVVWFYIAIDSGTVSLKGSLIQVSHNLLDDVQAYIYQNNQLLSTGRYNNNLPFSQREFTHSSLLFPLDIDAGSSYQLLFRVESDAFIDFPVYLHTLGSGLKVVGQRGVTDGFYYGMVSVMVLYNLFLFFATRDIAYLNYVCFVSSIALIIASIDGGGYQYIWSNYPQLNSFSVNLFTSLSVVFGTLFTTTFLGIWKQGGFQAKYYAFLLLASTLSAVLVFIGVIGSVQSGPVVLALIAYPSYLATGIIAWRSGQPSARYFTVAWVALCVFVIILSTAAIGIVNVPVNNLWPLVRYGSAMEMVLLSLALAAKINEMKIREKLALHESDAKSDFIAQVSHELRTPMNGILGMSQLLSDRLKDKTSRHYNSVIYQSGLALLGVINDVLDAAKIDAEKLEIEHIAFDLHSMVKDTLCVIEPQAMEKSIDINCRINEDVPQWVMGDPHRIKQVLLNFLSNAIKFTEQGSIELLLELASAPEVMQFSVVDTGVGIPENKLKDLFKPYSQVATSTARRYGGTGLGLYICRRLIGIMGGEIKAIANPAGGSIFSISLSLPRCSPLSESRRVQQECYEGKSLKILVAEDNKVNQTVIRRMLEKLGHKVTLVQNGLEAVEAAQDGYFNLILMDCDMPEMDGYEATKAIINEAQREGMRMRVPPIVAVTAHALQSYHDKAIKAGMTGIITKPIKIDVLAETILQYAQYEKEQSDG